MISLVAPDVRYKDSYLEALDEYQAEGRELEQDAVALAADFAAYVRHLEAMEQGLELPRGWVPFRTFWIIDEDGCVVGHVSVRKELNEHLRKIGGHIGYAVRPSKRNRGYGSRALELALHEAKELGLSRVLLTCDSTNSASRKIIEKNGGVLEDSVPQAAGLPEKLRFWIQV